MGAEPTGTPLRLYGTPSEVDRLAWSWVEQQLVDAGTYWVSVPTTGFPHPRPVWGVWLAGELLVTLGSPALRRGVAAEGRATVNLPSGTDVVVVEGAAAPLGPDADLAPFLAAYDAKYDWRYDVDEYGPPTRVVPATVLAWQAAGPAGRDGFRAVGRWEVG